MKYLLKSLLFLRENQLTFAVIVIATLVSILGGLIYLTFLVDVW